MKFTLAVGGKTRYIHGNFTEISQKNGFGVITFSNQEKYYGDWELDAVSHVFSVTNCQKSGFGVHIDADGTCFEGLWKSNKRKGPGKLSFPNGGSMEVRFKLKNCMCV